MFTTFRAFCDQSVGSSMPSRALLSDASCHAPQRRLIPSPFLRDPSKARLWCGHQDTRLHRRKREFTASRPLCEPPRSGAPPSPSAAGENLPNAGALLSAQPPCFLIRMQARFQSLCPSGGPPPQSQRPPVNTHVQQRRHSLALTGAIVASRIPESQCHVEAPKNTQRALSRKDPRFLPC